MKSNVVRFLAGNQGEYLSGFLLPEISKIACSKIGDRRDAIAALNSPDVSTSFALYYFAFARAGGERAGYKNLALKMFETTKGKNFASVWPAFAELCRKAGVGANEKLNRRPIEGLMQVHHSGHFGDAGLFAGIADQVRKTGVLAKTYLELLEVVGLGEKISAFLLRDLVWIYDLEERVAPTDRMFLQPIDVWVRRAAEAVFMRPFPERVPSLTIGHLLAEACRQAQVSGIAFNQGAWFFGSQKVKKVDGYRKMLGELVNSTVG